MAQHRKREFHHNIVCVFFLYPQNLSLTYIRSGNNVASFKGRQATQAKESSGGLNFNAEYKDTLDPTNPVNLDAARTNAFFVMNVMHDFSYRYGFTETAFNFQLSNFGKGGEEQDRVLVSVQDASGTNNANFATPPEYV